MRGIGAVVIIISIVLFVSGFIFQHKWEQPQEEDAIFGKSKEVITVIETGVLQVSHLRFIVAAVFLCTGIICFGIAELADNNDKLDKIIETQNIISKHYSKIEDSENEKNEIEKSEIEKENSEEELEKDKERSSKINTYEDLINDPKIKEESEVLLKCYGQKAQENFLRKEMEKLGIEYKGK